MTRERNKPEKSWLEKAEEDLVNSEELIVERAYGVGKIRGKKETIDKALEWLKEHIYDYIAVGNTDFGKPYDIDLCSDELFKDFKKAMEE